LSEVYTALSLILFERIARKTAETFQLDQVFRRAAIYSHPVAYSAKIILNAVVSAVIVSIPLVVTVLTINIPVAAKAVITLVSVIVPLVVLALGFAYPYIKVSSRNTAIANEFPFFLVYAATLFRGGVGLEKVIERVSELKLFTGMRAEAQRILARCRFFGEDPITAIEKIALDHPNSRFKDVILGYTTTLKTGGDVLHYLQVRTEEVLSNRMNDIKALVSRLASYLEAYIVFGVIVSLTVFVLFASMGAVGLAAGGTAGLSLPIGFATDPTLPTLYNFIVVPAIGTLVLLAIHGTIPKSQVNIREPLLVLVASLPIGIVIGIATALTLSPGLVGGIRSGKDLLSLLVGLAVLTVIVFVPPAIDYFRISRRQRGLVRSTASFLRDFSEARKTGLSPERCIISLSTRPYGALSPVVRKAAAALYSGISVEAAVKRALRGIRDWFTLVIFRFLVDSISVGGGSPEIIDSLARFTTVLTESEIELKRRLKVYVILPYFGSILIASAPVIILWLLTSFTGMVQPAGLLPLITSLAVGSYINSLVMGLIAGVTSEQIIYAGFKHIVAMSTLSISSVLITFYSIGIT
ncbi:MAG: type II secretion system F family protein, partial [Sulfolobales archaeon]|nr:type II secretion system F family protein [Sulfolobales archaeon]